MDTHIGQASSPQHVHQTNEISKKVLRRRRKKKIMKANKKIRLKTQPTTSPTSQNVEELKNGAVSVGTKKEEVEIEHVARLPDELYDADPFTIHEVTRIFKVINKGQPTEDEQRPITGANPQKLVVIIIINSPREKTNKERKERTKKIELSCS